MSGVRLEISINDGGLGDMLRRASELADNLEPALEASGSMMAATFDRRFEDQKGPGGIPWIPSKAALGLAPRASSGRIQPGKTLIDRGALRASIGHAVSPNQVEIGSVSTPTGDVDVKAAALQFGVAGINLPARPFVGFDDQDVADLEDLWSDVVRSALDEH